MNILVLSNCPTVESQGSGYVIINTAKCLKDLGHQVDIIPPEVLNFLPSWESRGRNYRMAIGMGKWVFLNRKRVAKYNLIIFYGAESAFAVFILKHVLNLSIPVILHSNGLELHATYRMQVVVEASNARKWYHFDHAWIFKYCYKNVDAIINVSKYDHEFAIEKLCLDPDKTFYIEPSLPEVFFNYKPAGIEANRPIIAYCGTWISRKGVDVIKETIPAILRKYPEYTFRIIGTGNEFNATDHFPEDIINRLELFVFVDSKEQMIKLYSEASIFVFPSVYESFGLVVAEAMFCGCATICGKTGYGASVIDREEALVLEEPDAVQLYDALEKLITNDTLRERLAVNGKKRTQKLRWSNYALKLRDIIENVSSRHQESLNANEYNKIGRV